MSPTPHEIQFSAKTPSHEFNLSYPVHGESGIAVFMRLMTSMEVIGTSSVLRWRRILDARCKKTGENKKDCARNVLEINHA